MSTHSSEKKYRAIGHLPEGDNAGRHPADATAHATAPSDIVCRLPTR